MLDGVNVVIININVIINCSLLLLIKVKMKANKNINNALILVNNRIIKIVIATLFHNNLINNIKKSVSQFYKKIWYDFKDFIKCFN